MPVLLYFLGLSVLGAVAYRAGQNKVKTDRVTELPPLVNGSLCTGCFEVHHEGKVGLATFEQAIEIGRACPGAKFRRIG